MGELKCLICKKGIVKGEFFCKKCSDAKGIPTFDEYLENIVSKIEKVAYGDKKWVNGKKTAITVFITKHH